MLRRYMDVTHAVQPVTSGYRLVLIYNLVMGSYCAIPSNPISQPVTDIRNIRYS